MAYRIGELAKLININEHTLRYYEKEGLVIPERDKNNIRVYTEDNKLWAEFIIHMKATGMSLEDLKQYTELWALGKAKYEDLVKMLKNHREHVVKKIEMYQANLELLDTKIDFYTTNINKNEDNDLFERFIEKKESES